MVRGATGVERWRRGRRYLEERALEPETIAQFRVGYAPDRRGVLNGDMLSRDFTETQLLEVGLLRRPEDRTDAYDFFRDRIIFPIADRQNRVIAFGGRALGEARAKYLNSPETDIFQKGRTLYNLAAARQAAHETGKVIVAEGYMDVIALHRAGIRHAVAPLGTALTEEQMRGLWRLAAEPTLCFDGDAAGKRAAGRAAERALPLLEPGRSLGFIELAPGQDPDSLLATAGSQALQEALEEPKPLARLLLEGALEGRRLDTPERRAGLRRDLGRLAAQIGNETVREYYRQFFRQELNKLFGDKRANRNELRGSSQHNNPGWRNVPARALPAHNGLTSDDAATVRGERLLLSVILNHPALLDEVFDEFSVLRFNSPTLDRLHRLLLEHVGLHQALDAAVLKHDLTDSALRDEVDDLTGENAAKLAPFASADAPMDEARKGWALIYGVSRLPGLEADLRAAREAAEKELTDESQSRHEAVRTELERARREAEKMTGSGFEEAGPL